MNEITESLGQDLRKTYILRERETQELRKCDYKQEESQKRTVAKNAGVNCVLCQMQNRCRWGVRKA